MRWSTLSLGFGLGLAIGRDALDAGVPGAVISLVAVAAVGYCLWTNWPEGSQ